MAPVPVKPAPPAEREESFEARFRRLAEAWDKETAHLSSMSAASRHPAYQEIVRLGPSVVPLLLRDMEANHTHWFTALRELTGANPVPETVAGNIPGMVRAWLDWAGAKGY